MLDATRARELEPDAILEGLSHLGVGSNELFAGLDHSFTRLSVQTRWPSSSEQIADFLAFHAREFPEQHARLGELRERPDRMRLVELETESGHESMGCTISSVGPGPAADDVQFVAQVAGLGDPEKRALDGVVNVLAEGDNPTCDAISCECAPGGRNNYYLRFARSNSNPSEEAETERAILSAAEAVGVCEPHRELAHRTLPLLARTEVCLVSASAADARVRPALTVEYVEVSWETALRVVRDLADDTEPAERLGALAGLANRETCMLRMSLGAEGIPRLTLWTTI